MLDSALLRSQQDIAHMHLSGHDTCNFLLLMERLCETKALESPAITTKLCRGIFATLSLKSL